MDLYRYKVVEVLRVAYGDTLDLRLSLGFGLTAARGRARSGGRGPSGRAGRVRRRHTYRCTMTKGAAGAVRKHPPARPTPHGGADGARRYA
jgi:hypothetical protein